MIPIVMDGKEYWPGIYPGSVVANNVGNGRIRVRVGAVYSDDVADDSLPAARACYPGAGNFRGDDKLPNTGDQVWVMFEAGDASYPVWMGRYLSDEEERACNKKDIVSGTEEKHIVEDKVTSIGGSEVKVIKGQQVTTARRQKTEYTEVEEIVLGKQVITVGRRISTVKGKDETTVQGPLIYEVLGPIQYRNTGNMSFNAGGNAMFSALGTATIRGVNSILGSIPVAGNAVKIAGVSGMVDLTASSLVGTPGSWLKLDSIGALTNLYSMVLLTLLSPLVMIGYAAALPAVSFAHVHIGNLGAPTGPAMPNPTGTGLCTTILVPPI